MNYTYYTVITTLIHAYLLHCIFYTSWFIVFIIISDECVYYNLLKYVISIMQILRQEIFWNYARAISTDADFSWLVLPLDAIIDDLRLSLSSRWTLF